MFRRFPIPILCLCILGAAACQPAREAPVVVTNSPLALEAEPPLIQGGEIPPQKLLDPNRVIARVDDAIITVRSILAEIGEAIEAVDTEDPAAMDRIRFQLEQYTLRMILTRLQLAEAKRLGIEVTPDEKKRLISAAEASAKKRGTTLEEDLRARGIPRWEWEEGQQRQLLAEKYLSMAIGELPPVSAETRAIADIRVRPAEIRDFFDRHPEEFKQEEGARVGAIYIRNVDFDPEKSPGKSAEEWVRGRAADIVARARRGEDFEKLVAEIHGKPLEAFSKPFKRGDRGGDLAEEFAWKARKGDVSDPIELPNGRLILKLLERTEDRVLSFAEVKGEITTMIRVLKGRAAQAKVRSWLLDQAVVEPPVYKERLSAFLAQELERILTELSR